MASEIELDADLIRDHATRVHQSGQAVRLAEDAARSLDLGGGAFGLLCSFLVPPASLVSSVAAGTITATAELIEREVEALRALAADVDGVEAENSTQIADVQGRVHPGAW